MCHSTTGAAPDAQRPSIPQEAPEDSVIVQLRLLATDLGKQGYTAQVLRKDDGSWGVHVQNPSAPDYSDLIYAHPDEGGAWWLWWSWKHRLTPIADIDIAASTIASVLEPVA